MGLIAWQEGVILVSEEPGSGAGQTTWEISDYYMKSLVALPDRVKGTYGL